MHDGLTGILVNLRMVSDLTGLISFRVGYNSCVDRDKVLKEYPEDLSGLDRNQMQDGGSSFFLFCRAVGNVSETMFLGTEPALG